MTRTPTIALALAATITAAAAQPFPSRPVTMVVPFGAGGPTDALARIVAERMRSALGQTVLVENVTGASGTIGIGRVARAAADGYTMVLGNWPSFVVASAIYANLSYDVGKDFEPIAQLPNNPYIVVSKKDLPAKDLKELIAYIKANPGKLSAGTGGAGSGQHVSGVYFQKVTGTQLHLRALSRGLRRRDARPDGRAHRLDLRPGDQRAAVRAQRTGAGLCDHRQDAACVRARYPDRGRGRRARRLHLHLVRAVGAEGHAGRGRGEARRGRAGGACRSGGAEAPERSRPGDSAREPAEARPRSPRISRPRWTNGRRSSRTRTSRWINRWI